VVPTFGDHTALGHMLNYQLTNLLIS